MPFRNNKVLRTCSRYSNEVMLPAALFLAVLLGWSFFSTIKLLLDKRFFSLSSFKLNMIFFKKMMILGVF